MAKHTIFVAAVILVVAMAAEEATRAAGVPSEPMALGLPVETVDSYV